MGETVKMSFEGREKPAGNWQMNRILIILKKENGPKASSAPALGLNAIIFKHVYWYMQQISAFTGPLVLWFSLPLTKVDNHIGHVRIYAMPYPISWIMCILDSEPNYTSVIIRKKFPLQKPRWEKT